VISAYFCRIHRVYVRSAFFKCCKKKLTCLTDVGTGCGDVTWLLPALGSCWFFTHLVQPTVECRLGDVVLRPSCNMPLCLFHSELCSLSSPVVFVVVFFCRYSLEISNYQLSYHRPLSVHWGSKITPSFFNNVVNFRTVNFARCRIFIGHIYNRLCRNVLFGILCTTKVIFKTARLKLADFLQIIRERNWAFLRHQF